MTEGQWGAQSETSALEEADGLGFPMSLILQTREPGEELAGADTERPLLTPLSERCACEKWMTHFKAVATKAQRAHVTCAGQAAGARGPPGRQPLPSPFCSWRRVSFPEVTALQGGMAGTGARGTARHPRALPPISCCLPCLGIPAGGPWLPGFLSGGSPWMRVGTKWGPSPQWVLFSQGATKLEGGGLSLPHLPLWRRITYGYGVGVGGRKPQHPAFQPRPQLLCICLFTLEKAPQPRQEMGQFQEARPGWGTRSHIVLGQPLPTLGLPREPGQGDLRGGPAGRGRGAEGCQRSQPAPPRKRASVQEWDGGCRVPACLGVEEARTPAEDGPLAWPRAHLAPTCQPRVRGDLGAARPWCPQLFLGRCRPPVGGQPALCLPSPVHTPARQLAHPRASLPGVGLEAGESCGQSLALAVKAQAGVGLDGVMWALGEG